MRMYCFSVVVFLLAAVACTAADDPSAPDSRPREESAEHDWGVKGGLGFTADPGAFLLGLEGEYSFTPDFRMGPLLQIATEDDTTIVAPTLNLKYIVPMPRHVPGNERFHPFVQAGLGLAWVEKERRGRHDHDEVGFFMNTGFGCDYMLTERFGLGTSLLFNVLPAETADERFFFSWQLVTATIRF